MRRATLTTGATFVVVGVLLGLEQEGLVRVLPLLARWWPLAVIAAGLARLVARPRDPLGATIITTVGAVLLLRTLDVVGSLRLIWPVLLIVLGAWLLVGPGRRSGDGPGDG